MTEHDNAALVDLANRFADAKHTLTVAENQTKLVKEVTDKLEAQLFDALEAAGLLSIRTERGLFRVNDLAWPKIIDAAAAKTWADATMPELMTLNHQRLGKLIRDALRGELVFAGAGDNGLPPGIDYTTTRKINWRVS